MAKLLSGTRIYGNATVDTSITVGTNVAAANVVITNASRLGTVTSGTWNGSSISTTYTDAKIVSVSNTAPISASTSAGVVTVGLLNSGVSATTYGNATVVPVITVDQYGRVTSASNVTITASSGSGTGGYSLSTITTFPGSAGNVDYGDTTNSADAFGVSLIALYDCMEPSGSMVYQDFAAL